MDLHPQPKWQRVSTYVDGTAAHRLAGWEGCGRPLGLPRVRDVLPGGGGLDRTTKGAGTDRPCCLLPTACLKTNSTLRRETCEERHARLPCGEVSSASSTDGPTARSEFTRPCAPLRSAVTTGANGAGPWECTASVPLLPRGPGIGELRREGPGRLAPAMALQSPPICQSVQHVPAGKRPP